ncbi:MAG: T9SS type A sorting domain-containing protein [Bacteroidetes bacterium]|nr:MAG: T9SS type A sorting domain-containing protein [Bacteroidota bacterium]
MKKSILLSSVLTLTFGLWTLSSSAQVCFTASQDYQAGSSPYSIVKADFNGDGKVDLAVANRYDNSLSVYLGNGAGVFGTASIVAVGSEPVSLNSTDFNADGKADLAVANYNDNTVSVYLGNGAGGFGAPLTLPLIADAPMSVTSADFNGDGKKDLAVTYDNGPNVSILIGNGLGGFAAAVNYNVGYWYNYSVMSDDFNGDGKGDLAIANNDDSRVSIMIGNGDGTFQPAVDYFVGGCPSFISVGDMNSDSKKDIIVSSSCGNVYFLSGNGNGTFNPAATISTNANRSNAVADFNGDGNLDVAAPMMSQSNIQLFLGNGNGTFGAPQQFNTGSSPYSVASADFNGDGKMDLATANYNDNTMSVLLNTNLPPVAANASATTICPGSSVILTGTGAGTGGTNVYTVLLSDLFNQGSNCGNGGVYGNNPGFNWMSTEPIGSNIASITIQVNCGVDCSGGNHTGLVNGNNIGSVNFGGSWCNCSLRDYIVTYTSSPGFYNVGGSNSFQMNGSTFGMCPNSGWAAGVYAKVTVTYGASYSWTGGAINGVPFIPGATATYTVTGTTLEGCTNTAPITITVLPAISNVVNPTDASCLCNGTANVIASGGTAPFSYLWSNGNTTTATSALCAGNYTITTTDSKGCTKTSVAAINASPAMSFSDVTTNASCLCSGTTSVTVTGGTGPYAYSWSNGATTSSVTGLCPGTYTLTATDSYSVACSNVTTVTIANTPTLAFNTLKTNATCTAACNGGATVTVTGGTGPYTYAWSPSGGTTSAATGLCAGTTYTITATDANGCTNVGNTIAIGVTPLAVSFVNTNANCSTSCNGTSTASVVGGTGSYTYAWAPSGGTNATATGLCGGTTYTLTVTANACSQVVTTTIASNPIVAVSMFNNTPASCNSVCNGTSTASATGGIGAYTYSWLPTGGTTASAAGLCAGTTYTLTVRDANGCSSSSTTNIGLNSNPLYINNINIDSDASCSAVCNGTATANVFGGGGSYSYSWSPSGGSGMTATGLCGSNAGLNYTLTVTDAVGCKDTMWETIYLVTPMNINFSTVGVACSAACNGTASVSSVSGGNSPYSYLWSNGSTTTSITGLCAGTYSSVVTVTDSLGCKMTEDVTINNSNNGVQTNGFDSWNTFCNTACTGSAIGYIDQNSSMGPYTYWWSNGSTTTTISGLCAGTYTFMVTDEDGCSDWDDVTINTNSNLNYSTNITDASCEQVCNGMVALSNFSGGAGPYSYQWLPGGGTTASITGLCSDNTYTVTVTDVNGCTKTTASYVDYNYQVYVNTWSWDASCNGICNGKDSADAFNGNTPYTYLWSNGATTAVATGLCGDYNNGITYTVTVMDSIGCKAWEEEDIYTNNPPSISLTTTNVFCNSVCSGTASAFVSGGVMPYTYTWSNGATTGAISNLCAGPYTLTVKDSKGCMSVSSFNINSSGSNISVSTTSTDATCDSVCNGMASATASGGTAPYAYAWSPSGGSAASAAALCAGSYTVTVTDVNGCSKTKTTMIDQPAALVTNITVTNATSCVQGDGTATANVAGGTGPFTYVWTPTGQITQTAVTLPNGTYSVSVTDANGCATTGSGVVSCTSGITELAAESMFSVSPNPTIGNMVVTAANKVSMDQIAIDNVLGQTVYSMVNSKHQSAVRIDITAQPSGIYFMSVKSNGNIYTQKIIKQ